MRRQVLQAPLLWLLVHLFDLEEFGLVAHPGLEIASERYRVREERVEYLRSS